jgi:hypothetical protein
MTKAQPYTDADLKRGAEIVQELHGLKGYEAWSEHIAKAIAAARLAAQADAPGALAQQTQVPLISEEDVPTKWLVDALRSLARELVANPKTPWIGERDPRQHICWTAADRLLGDAQGTLERLSVEKLAKHFRVSVEQAKAAQDDIGFMYRELASALPRPEDNTP